MSLIHHCPSLSGIWSRVAHCLTSWVGETYKEVDIKIATATKFSVANLEGDRHLVILVQRLVEAFSRMGAELDVVRVGDCKERERGEEEPENRCHRGQSVGVRMCRW